MLKLNSEKTEVMLVASKNDIKLLDKVSVNVENINITSISEIRSLGVILDSTMSMEKHVNSVTKSAYHMLYKISRIRRYLSEDVTKTLVNSLVTSRLDYCNSLLYGLPSILLNKLQKVQNTAARIIKRIPRQNHITPILKELHWLPVKYRIEYKSLLITYKALNGQAPSYISGMIEECKPSRSLRSQSSLQLKHPSGLAKRSYGQRSYHRAAPLLWNALPKDTRNAKSLSLFKCLLKTYYFKKHYSQNEAI